MEQFFLTRATLDMEEGIRDYLSEFVEYGSNINGTGFFKKILNGRSFREALVRNEYLEDSEYAKKTGKCPGKTLFLIRADDRKIIGAVNLRWDLDEEMLKFIGHIGYSIRPTERRKGYGKLNLYLALKESEKLGLDRVMISCRVSNPASDRTIQALGGVLERSDIDPADGELTNVYWIEVKQALEEYRSLYEPLMAPDLGNDRPVTTLFMLMSADGKISTGSSDELDMDADLPGIEGVREGLHQYYEIEQTTDLWSFNTGRTQAKIGVNEKPLPAKTPVSFVVLDNSHIKESGVRYFCARSDTFVLITTDPSHPAFNVSEDNLHIILQDKLSLKEALIRLKKDFGCERVTIQCGGTVNSLFLRQKLIDYVDIVVAPLLVGGKDTPTLIDGISLTAPDQLAGLGVLRLLERVPLEDSYLRLRYKVIY